MTRHAMKAICAAVLAGVLVLARPVAAQTLEDLRQQILVLQKRIDQLEAEQRRTAARREAADTPRAVPAVPRIAPGTTPGTTPRTARGDTAAAQQAAAEARAAAVTARAEADRAKAEAQAAFAPPPGKPRGTFRIPGTDTSVRLYGEVKLNALGDLTTFNQNDALTAQSIELFNSSNQRTGGSTQVSARRSRFGIETFTPINDVFGEFHTLVEMDFAGQNTSMTTQATSNSYTPRLRKAYAEVGKPEGGWGTLLVGQTDTLFSDSAILPLQWVSDWTFVGMDLVRQGQVRYTYGFGDGLSLAAAVESPYSDVTTTAGVSYPDSNGGNGYGWNQVPDFTARLMWKQPWATMVLRAVLRPQIDLNNNGNSAVTGRFNKSVTGYGIGPTLVVPLLGGDLKLMGSANIGNGIGRYLDATSNGYGAISNAGLPGVTPGGVTMNAPLTYAGMFGIQYYFLPTLRANAAIGGARIINPSFADGFGGCAGSAATSGSCSTLNKSEWASSINIIWSAFPAVDVGLEYQHVERVLQNAFAVGPGNAKTTGGIANRIQFMTIGRF